MKIPKLVLSLKDTYKFNQCNAIKQIIAAEMFWVSQCKNYWSVSSLAGIMGQDIKRFLTHLSKKTANKSWDQMEVCGEYRQA